MTPERLAQLRQIAEKATSGPWHWAGNTDTGEPYLATWIPGAGRCQVLTIGTQDRSTTSRAAKDVREYAKECGDDPEEIVKEWATDKFGDPVREPRLQFVTDLMCVNARDHVIYEVAPDATSRDDERVYRADITGIRHPDAEFIATFNPATARELVDEIERLRSENAQLAGSVLDSHGADCVYAQRLAAVEGMHQERSGTVSALYLTPLCSCGEEYPCDTIQVVRGI